MDNFSKVSSFEFFIKNGFDFYFLDEATIARIAVSCIGSFPLVKKFFDVSNNETLKAIEDLGFIQIVGAEDFNKESKGYDGKISGYIHPTEKIFIAIYFQEEMDMFSIESLGYESEATDKITNLEVFYSPNVTMSFLSRVLRTLEKVALIKLQSRPKKNHINFLCFDNCYRLKNVKVNRSFNMDLKLNYGPEFIKVHDHLLRFLNSDDSGLAILHGVVGSGKTSYLRYLLGVLDKKVIYVPPHLINRVAEPDFLSFLLKQSDFILLIEDAEEIVTNREDTKNTAGVSNLLNLSDGILGDCIKARCIVTFNTEVKNIDPALLRKGRLKLEYQFDKLSVDLSNKLLLSLGMSEKVTEPTTLANLYNLKNENFRQEKVLTPVGFAAFKN